MTRLPPRSALLLLLPLLPLLAVALLLSACSAPGGAGLPPDPDDRAAAVESGVQRAIQVEGREVESYSIAERMETLGVPAVSVAVIHDGRIDWARAWGLADVETGRAATAETLFQAASMSKPIAALTALVMADAGQVDLDADVNEALSSWKVPANGFTSQRPVTLRGLLSHTAGVTVHGFPGYAPGTDVPTPVQVLDAAGPTNTPVVRVDTVPGSLWRYSGGGYTIAQQLMEDVAGTPYADLVRDRVLEPLGMRHSTSAQPLPDRFRDRAATAYRGDGSPIDGRYHTYPEMAAAGLWTTPSDYARYALGIQAALQGQDGAIIARETARDMLTEVMGGYGVGVGVSGEGDALRFSHGGANAGFRSTFHGFPERGEGIVVMTNSDNGAPLAQEIVQSAARVYGWPGLEPRVISPFHVAGPDLNAYTGTYQVGDIVLTVTRTDDRLLLAQDDGQPLELVPTDIDTFVYMGGGFTVTFHRDEAGGVEALEARGTRVERVTSRAATPGT
ncbi:MAG TPA: serine hydrolase domain-containing protein [Longimicrobiales bacterium]|nr:serine hydrolase domain-containing protein [Longimicrobiales bacterium]